MDELRELYQEVILDHGKKPRNFRYPEPSNRSAEGYNPLCGDKITLKLYVDGDGVIRDVGFQGSGCAISQAASSTMTEAVKGKTVDEVRNMSESFRHLVTDESSSDDAELPSKLSVFGGVAAYPMRVKCATLAWHTLEAALEGKEQATTE